MSSMGPAVVLYDANGVPMAVEDGAEVPAGTRAVLVAGSDGTAARVLKTATDGALAVEATTVINGNDATQQLLAVLNAVHEELVEIRQNLEDLNS